MQSLVVAVGSGLAFCAMMFALASWFRNAMTAEFARGEVFGRAAHAAEAAAQAFARRQADDALLEITNADLAALEDERDRLEAGLYGLEREISDAGDGPVCVGPGLVRSLGGPIDSSDARSERP